MHFRYQIMLDWPKLAWEATLERGSDRVLVRHGRMVETRADWFCEAAWDAPFSDGNFDQTDIVVGSGARLRESKVIFVSAGNTVDRLQSLMTSNGYRISNSLACLVAGGGVELDPSYRHYFRDFTTVTRGIRELTDQVHTRYGELRLHYFDNLVWSGALTKEPKPSRSRDFRQFDVFEDFLVKTMAAVSGNAADRARRQPFAGLGTLSTGYDSCTVAALSKRVEAFDEVMTFASARGDHADDGTPIARQLGLRATKVDRCLSMPEVSFLASDAYGSESHYAGAEHLLSGRILYTGFHGDNMWGKSPKAHPLNASSDTLGPNLVRGDPTGLALTEYRLRAGFLHCAVPFWGVRHIADVVMLSNSAELRQWDVPGSYSRPICRRIVEEAGVDGSLFGQAKKAASVMMQLPGEKFISKESLEDYEKWLRSTSGTPSPDQQLLPAVSRSAEKVLKVIPSKLVPATLSSYVRYRSLPMFYHLFPWAVERAAAAYKRTA
jgi:hypothetical protein